MQFLFPYGFPLVFLESKDVWQLFVASEEDHHILSTLYDGGEINLAMF